MKEWQLTTSDCRNRLLEGQRYGAKRDTRRQISLQDGSRLISAFSVDCGSVGRGLATLVAGFDSANPVRGGLKVPYLLASGGKADNGERPVDGGGMRKEASVAVASSLSSS
jgi:hypothetical protein